MVAPDKYTAEKILWIRPWAPNLFSFRLTRFAGFRFVPGQFARLGVKKPDPNNPKNPTGEKIAWRAYSIVSADYDEHLEFYSIVVPGLWMLSTGTGLAPFISMLWDPRTWELYENLVLVHSVRYPNELAYAETIEGIRRHELFAPMAHKLHYVQAVTRAAVPGALCRRIPAAIDDGSLERHAGLPLEHARSRIMICGNPEMVDDTRKLLAARGYTTSRRGAPGHLAVENYW